MFNEDVVEVSIKVKLPKSLVQKYKEDPSYGFDELTDEEVVTGLAEDILLRYFNPEYFDVSRIAP